jgi:phage gpG-like protein
MQVRFTGDFASLQRFAKKIQKTPDMLVTVNEQLAEETVELVRQCFEESRDPYGNPWPAPVLREGRPLEDSGALKAAWHRRWAGRHGFAIGNAKAYAKHHQKGTGVFGPRHTRIRPKKAKALRLPGPMFVASVKGAPARKMVPDQGLPARWRDRYVETAQEVLTELFRR